MCLLTASLIASIACITRYAGITLVATGGILILAGTGGNLLRKFRNALLFGLVACTPLAINLIRNYRTGGTLTGFREKSNISFGKILHSYSQVFSDWLPFFGKGAILSPWIGVMILLISGYGAYRILRKKNILAYENIAILYLALYSVFIITGARISRFEEINSRLLSPAFIPFIWAASSWIPAKLQYAGKRKRWGITGLAFSLALIFLAGQCAADYETWDGVKDAGIPGYTEDDWTQSPTVLWIRQNKDQFGRDTLYADANDAVYFFTGLPCRFIPHKESAGEISQFLAVRRKWIIWFDDGENPDLVEMDYLQSQGRVTLVKKLDDGAVFYTFSLP